MSEEEICYICYEGENEGFAKVPPPCKCTGSIVIHKRCLQEQINRDIFTCTICHEPFHEEYVVENAIKLYNQWGYMVRETKKFLWPEDRSYGKLEKLFYDADENGFMEVYEIDSGYKAGYYNIVGGKKNGIGYEYNFIGQIKVLTFVDGKKHGRYWRYDHSGALRETGWYDKGKKQGLVREYNLKYTENEIQNCMYRSIGYYHTSEREGIFLHYEDSNWGNHEFGTYENYRVTVLPYNLGMKHGIEYEYVSNVGLQHQTQYIFDYKMGLEKKWYKNGNLEYIRYNNRESIGGLLRKYHRNGQLEVLDYNHPTPSYEEDEDYFRMGDRQMLSHAWYENGQIRYAYEPHRTLHWYYDGQAERIQTRKEGLYRMWREGGQLWSLHYAEGWCLASNDPLVQAWNEDGTIILKGQNHRNPVFDPDSASEYGGSEEEE